MKKLLFILLLPCLAYAQTNTTPQFKRNVPADSLLGYSIPGITGNHWLPDTAWVKHHVSGGGGGGVTQFNTRTGAVTLTSGDVTTALTFTPENVANKTATASASTSTYPNWLGLENYSQPILVSGTNIKTINSTSLLGSGDIVTENIGNTDLTSTGNRTFNLNNNSLSFTNGNDKTTIYADATSILIEAGSASLAGAFMDFAKNFWDMQVGAGVGGSNTYYTFADTSGLRIQHQNIAGQIKELIIRSHGVPDYNGTPYTGYGIEARDDQDKVGLIATSQPNWTGTGTSSLQYTTRAYVDSVATAGSGGVPTSRTLTINGTTFDLTANRTWTVGDALIANPLSQFAATTSAQLRGVLSDESGTGVAYFQGGDIGTPSAGVATNLTGTASGLTAGNATLAANLSGTPALPNGTTATTQTTGDNTAKLATDVFVNASISAITAISGANPTATIGFTAVNGSASSFTRSDGAPKADSTIIRSVANSYSLAAMQTKLNNYLLTSASSFGGSAAKLTTARNINNIAFDGTANIFVTPQLTAIKTANYTLAANEYAIGNATAGTFTFTLPNAPADGTVVGVKMVNTSGTNVISLATQGADVFNGGSTSATIALNYQAITFQYKLSNNTWYSTSTNLALGLLDTRYLLLANQGTNTTVYHGNASGSGSFSAIGLTTDVTGILPAANGGSGVNNGSFTQTLSGNIAYTGAFNPTFAIPASATYTFPGATQTLASLAGTETFTNKTIASSTDILGGVTVTLGSDATGDIHYRNSGGIFTRLAIGSTGNPIIVSGGLPSYSNLVLTNPASAATFTLASGKTLTVNNTLTIAATDGITMTTPTTSFTAARTDNANTFLQTQTFSRSGIGATPTDGISEQNTTAAVSGTQVQLGPRIRISGTGWTGAASQTADWTFNVIPIAGTNPITSKLVFSSQINAAGYVDRVSINNTGDLTALTGTIILHGYTVSSLPTGVQGMTAFVTDALTPSFGTTLVGGGAVVTKAFYNGTNWIAE